MLNGHPSSSSTSPSSSSSYSDWCGAASKIDHPSGEHDDYCNAVAGVVSVATAKKRLQRLTWGRPRSDAPAEKWGYGIRKRPAAAVDDSAPRTDRQIVRDRMQWGQLLNQKQGARDSQQSVPWLRIVPADPEPATKPTPPTIRGFRGAL